MIKITNIKQSYLQGKSVVKVLNGINLNISKGEKICFIGPSGSGKTTLLNILGLLENPISGSVLINSKNCNLMSLEQKTMFRRQYIGYIFQNNQLLEDFSVIENVAIPLILNNFPKRFSLNKAKEILKTLGLIDKVNFKPGTLSGGEQQRVAIARAVIKKPFILLADEPTGSLDEENTKKVMQIIFSIINKLGTALVLATHNLDLIKKFDRCYKVDDGLITEYEE
ncbi:MAG: ABC transporter ATP-binding protein [Alphaproteobacteria bacterium]